MIYSSEYTNLSRLSYRFEEDFLSTYIQIDSIGKETCTSPNYRFNGLTRHDVNKYLFQYTISGTGRIRIGKNVNTLPPGCAFLIEIPSDHEYYLDINDKKWEFIYIMLHGEWAKCLFGKITNCIGNVINIDGNSRLIQLLNNIFENIRQRNVEDFYEASDFI